MATKSLCRRTALQSERATTPQQRGFMFNDPTSQMPGGYDPNFVHCPSETTSTQPSTTSSPPSSARRGADREVVQASSGPADQVPVAQTRVRGRRDAEQVSRLQARRRGLHATVAQGRMEPWRQQLEPDCHAGVAGALMGWSLVDTGSGRTLVSGAPIVTVGGSR